MKLTKVDARYGWGKTIVAFIIGGGLAGFLIDVAFPHDDAASSIAFGIVLGITVGVLRPFVPRPAPPRDHSSPPSDRG